MDEENLRDCLLLRLRLGPGTIEDLQEVGGLRSHSRMDVSLEEENIRSPVVVENDNETYF